MKVFQNSAAQGEGVLGTALTLVCGVEVGTLDYTLCELVTPENIDQYMTPN